jgi:hypothetical protein
MKEWGHFELFAEPSNWPVPREAQILTTEALPVGLSDPPLRLFDDPYDRLGMVFAVLFAARTRRCR